MTDPIQLMTVEQAAALAASIPNFLDEQGAIRRAEAMEIVRRRTGWAVQIPRSRYFDILPDVRQPLASFVDDVAQVSGAEVVIGGYRIPVILAHAILGAYYVARESGAIVPAPIPGLAPTTIPQESTP